MLFRSNDLGTLAKKLEVMEKPIEKEENEISKHLKKKEQNGECIYRYMKNEADLLRDKKSKFVDELDFCTRKASKDSKYCKNHK